jgi:hypothetical protein
VTAVYLATLLIRFVPIGESGGWASASSTGVVDSGQRPLSWNLPGLTCLILLILTAVLGLAAALALLERRATLAKRLLGAAAITGTVPMVLPGLLAVTAHTWVSRMQQPAPAPPPAVPDSAGRRAMRQAPVTMLLLCLVLVVTAVAAAVVWRTTRQDVTPRWVHGTINNVSSSGTSLGLRKDGSAGITGYAVGPVGWTDANGVRHSGDRPACLAPGSHGQRVELGLIDYRPTAAADGGTVVVWVRCL